MDIGDWLGEDHMEVDVMSFNGNFPHQQVFKRFTLKEIHKLIVEKEQQGYEMVKPIYKETITDKFFTATEKKRKRWKFSEEQDVVKWIAIMKKVGDNHENTKTSC